MDFRVNHVEPAHHLKDSKFILTRQGDAIVYDAKQLTSEIEYHVEIAMKIHGRSNHVIGGGYVETLDETARTVYLTRDSGDFGAVPKIVLEQFQPALLEAYRTHHPELEEINLQPHDNGLDWQERWLKRQGFEYLRGESK